MQRLLRLTREVLTVQELLYSAEVVEFLLAKTLIQAAPTSNGQQRFFSRFGHPKSEFVISLSCNTEISNALFVHTEHGATFDNRSSFVFDYSVQVKRR